MTPMGDETQKEVRAVSREMAAREFKRRGSDTPKEHATRFVLSLVYALVMAGAAIALRVFHLIGEIVFSMMMFGAGIIVTGESLLGFVKTWRGKGDGPPPEARP